MIHDETMQDLLDKKNYSMKVLVGLILITNSTQVRRKHIIPAFILDKILEAKGVTNLNCFRKFYCDCLEEEEKLECLNWLTPTQK